MESSLTLGEMLLSMVAMEAMVAEGKKVFPKIQESARGLQIPDGLGSMIKWQKATRHIQIKSAAHLIVEDPWEPVAEKLLDHAFPKKGMSTYFVYYLEALYNFSEAEKNRLKSERRMAEVGSQQGLIDFYINNLTNELHCTTEDLPTAMAQSDSYNVFDVMHIQKALKMIKEVNGQADDLRKIMEKTVNLSYGLYGPLAILEELVKMPKLSDGGRMMIFAIQKTTHFASQKDFDLARKEAVSFLSSPGALRKIAFLSQGKRI